MKAALVKQVLDIHGSWSGTLWRDTSPGKLFDVWPSKALFWELTCMLQADWYIVPQTLDNDYTVDSVKRHSGRDDIIRKYTRNITVPEEIPFAEYDLVITFDPILKVPSGSRTLFAYYALEHWVPQYQKSLRKPMNGYDLFLAHMMDSRATIESLPQAISFPYVHDRRLIRSIFPAQKRESALIDWRTLTTLAMKDVADPWGPEAEAAASRLGDILDVPIHHRGRYYQQTYGFADPPQWGDAKTYFQALAESKYYVAVGRVAGAGQGLGDAAALGCLCIGQRDIAYHRVICHPSCLCEDMVEMPARLKALAASADLQQEVLAWQDVALEKHFERGPLQLLERALHLKARGYA